MSTLPPTRIEPGRAPIVISCETRESFSGSWRISSASPLSVTSARHASLCCQLAEPSIAMRPSPALSSAPSTKARRPRTFVTISPPVIGSGSVSARTTGSASTISPSKRGSVSVPERSPDALTVPEISSKSGRKAFAKSIRKPVRSSRPVSVRGSSAGSSCTATRASPSVSELTVSVASTSVGSTSASSVTLS